MCLKMHSVTHGNMVSGFLISIFLAPRFMEVINLSVNSGRSFSYQPSGAVEFSPQRGMQYAEKSFCYRIAPADVPVRVAQRVVAVRAGHPAIRNAVVQVADAEVKNKKDQPAHCIPYKIMDYAN